jgi:magnesium transporter
MGTDHLIEASVARIRARLLTQPTREGVAEELPGLHPREIAAIIDALDQELSLRLFCLLDPDLAAYVLGEISEECLMAVLAEAAPGCVVPVLKNLDRDDLKVASHIAEALPRLEPPRQIALFQALPRRVGAEVFSNLESDARDRLLAAFTDEETRQLLRDLQPDDRTALLDEVPGVVTQRLLNLLPPNDLSLARQLLGYPEDSVGRLMTPAYVAVRPEWPVQQALQHLRRQARRHQETFDVIYVTNDQWKLLDALDLRRFIFADPESTVADLMDDTFVSLEANEDRERAVEAMSRYDVAVLPVVDSEGIMLGIVTFDDVLDVVEEEVTEDFHKMGSVALAKTSLREAAFTTLYRARIGWLLILVFMNIFSGAGIAAFEDTLADYLALAFFLPLLIDSGGNAGSQAATLMVRALAIGEVHARDWFKLLTKEISVALALGVTMAIGVSIIASFRAPEVVAVVAMTMVTIVMVGSLIGMSLPFVLTKFGKDPATASAPLVTSLADISGVLIYFSIANLVLPDLRNAAETVTVISF